MRTIQWRLSIWEEDKETPAVEVVAVVGVEVAAVLVEILVMQEFKEEEKEERLKGLVLFGELGNSKLVERVCCL